MFPKNRGGPPKSCHLFIGFFHNYKLSILGYLYFWFNTHLWDFQNSRRPQSAPALLRNDEPRLIAKKTHEESDSQNWCRQVVGGGGEGPKNERVEFMVDIFYFHPYLGKFPILTNIFQMG